MNEDNDMLLHEICADSNEELLIKQGTVTKDPAADAPPPILP